MTTMSAGDLMRVADPIIHDVGTMFLADRLTMTRGKELGYGNLIEFYFAGRGGVLGEVDAEVVVAAMGWFHPRMVRSMWRRGVSVAGARGAAQAYFEVCAEYGRVHLGGFKGADDFARLAERVVTAAEGSGLPLFAGWRAMPRAPDAPGAGMQLIHVLREWRGAVHLVATTAAGLSPVEAVVTNDGPMHAAMLGWLDPPDCTHMTSEHAEAQATTDRLCTVVYERSLTGSERAKFATLAHGIKSRVTSAATGPDGAGR